MSVFQIKSPQPGTCFFNFNRVVHTGLPEMPENSHFLPENS